MIHIRKGKVEDIPAALELVIELATYEKAPHEVKVTVEEMTTHFLNKVFEFFVAEINGKIIGIALYYYKYSTWKGRCIYLDDIVVKEEYRNKGIGKQLMNALIDVAKKEKVRKLEWQVLKWNTPAIEFYKKYPTIFDDEWLNCKLSFE